MSKRKPPGATTRGGWGHLHQQRRRELEPLVRAGALNCARCGRRIEAGQQWHLDHHDDRNGYLGASHATCNARAGAHKANRNRHHGLPITRIWSRRWYDNADPGTIVYVDNDHADYFDGHEWRTVRISHCDYGVAAKPDWLDRGRGRLAQPDSVISVGGTLAQPGVLPLTTELSLSPTGSSDSALARRSVTSLHWQLALQ